MIAAWRPEPSTTQEVALLGLEVELDDDRIGDDAMYVDPETGQLMATVNDLPVID